MREYEFRQPKKERVNVKKLIWSFVEPFVVIAINIWRDWVKPNLQYLRYVVRHKRFVFVACFRLAVKYSEPRLIWRGLIHDLSKFRPSEWLPYVNYFNRTFPEANSDEARLAFRLGFNPKTKEEVQEAFDLAWNHHQKRNNHHWQYWLLSFDDGNSKVLDMPFVCVLEMIADWIGAGKALGKPDTKGWYLANKDKMRLHIETRRLVEGVLFSPPTETELDIA